MERAQAQRLQPHYIESFFREAFERLGGRIHRARDRPLRDLPRAGRAPRARPPDRRRRPGARALRAHRFDKAQIAGPAASPTFVCPGHPLLDATIDLVLERHRELLKQARSWSIARPGPAPARPRLPRAGDPGRPHRRDGHHRRRPQLQFVELFEDGALRDAGPAPYLDYRPAQRAPSARRRAAARGAMARGRPREPGDRLRRPASRAPRPRRGARPPARPDRQGRARGPGPAQARDQLLGPPRRRTCKDAGARRQAAAHELRSTPPPAPRSWPTACNAAWPSSPGSATSQPCRPSCSPAP